MMATRSPPVLSSAAVKLRPGGSGCTPSVVKKLAEIWPTSTLSGSPAPVNVRVVGSNWAMPSSVRFCSRQWGKGATKTAPAGIPTRRITPQDEPLWVRIGEWSQHQRIDDAEDRRVRSDAERQRERGDKSEAWIFQQHSKTEA